MPGAVGVTRQNMASRAKPADVQGVIAIKQDGRLVEMVRHKLTQVGDRDIDLPTIADYRLEELLQEAQERILRDSLARDAIVAELKRRTRATKKSALAQKGVDKPTESV